MGIFRLSSLRALATVALCVVEALAHKHHGAIKALHSRADALSGCQNLAIAAAGAVFFPDSDVYRYENAEFWSNFQIMDPACVFRPTSAKDVAKGIKALTKSSTPFAIRGGGHMGIKGANNINSPGVLMVMSNLTTLELSADKSEVSVGSGYRWGDVYEFLAPSKLTVAGGRLSPVGVPGLLLAGGINFYGNQKGFSADMVLEYEVVLADGSIVTASASRNSDLFWALKGGSSNFGIVTKFCMKTIPSTQVWAGTLTFAEEQIPAVHRAVAKYAASNPMDPKSHIIPAAVPSSSGDGSVFVVIMFYDSPTESDPACFKPFMEIPRLASSLAFKTVSQFANENGALITPRINNVFTAGTVVGRTEAELLKAIAVTNNTFYDHLPELHANIPSSDIALLQFDWQPIGAAWVKGSRASNPGGNPLLGGLKKVDDGAIYLAWAGVVEWTNNQGNHDAFVADWIKRTVGDINDEAEKAGVYAPFAYMGDAAGFEDIYGGYGAENQQKLLSISRRYDPNRVFQTLNPGGFKIGR